MFPVISLPLSFFLFFFLPPICFLKVFVCEMNRSAGRRDDSLHNDDIELISEMLQNRVVDVYHETRIIKTLLKSSRTADSGILFAMINFLQSL